MGFLSRLAVCLSAIVALYACGVGVGPLSVSAAELARGPVGPLLRVAIIGTPDDPRIPVVREALGFWNGELSRLGRSVRFDSGTVIANVPLPEDALGAASRAQPRPWSVYFNARLRSSLGGVDDEADVALSASPDIISFGVPFEGRDRHGIVALRPMNRWPLTLPNVARNVTVHELGHLLGLQHNADARTLMCGRPAPCRPAAFTSGVPRIFPLTPNDQAGLRQRWP
ncbi:MAG: hypothetical protein JWM95_3681 [Gemmatimonadetes bacterium]|nr:hypothetical protein [Gemmatimonadota bacterium]